MIRLSIVNTGADPRDFSPEGGGGGSWHNAPI